MPDQEFEEKGKSLKRGLQNTLALRVVTVTICFLVLPIIALSFILYEHEYDQKKQSNFFALDLIAHEIEDVVMGFIGQNETISETLEYVLSLPTKNRNELNELFHSLTKNEEVSDILYVEREGGSFYCRIASDKKYLGKNLTSAFSRVSLTGKKRLFFSHQFGKSGVDTLISAHPLYANGTDEPYGVILIFMSPGLFSSKIEFATNDKFPISTSILTSHGRVVASTREDFLQKRFAIQGHYLNPKVFRQEARGPIIPLDPVRKSTDNYTFSFDGDKRVAVYLPLQNTNHGVLIEMSNTINLVPVSTFLLRMLLIFAVIFVSGLIGTIWLTFRIVRPLTRLCTIMEHASEGNRDERYKRDPWGFEINVVGTIFNSMLDAFDRQVQEIRKERGAKEVLEEELLLGQKIQTSLLPQSLPQVPSLQIATGFISAKEVGGDYYDVLVREKDGKKQVLFSIADASGKGVYACLFSLSIRSMIRSYFMKGSALSDIVKDANNLFHIDADESSAFVTAWLGIYDVETKKLTFANCGHHPALHVKKDASLKELDAPNISLGVIPLESVTTGEVVLEQGDQIFLFTDGIIEAHNEKDELFGLERVKELAKQHHQNPNDLVQTLLSEVKAFSQGKMQHDDITLLSIGSIS